MPHATSNTTTVGRITTITTVTTTITTTTTINTPLAPPAVATSVRPSDEPQTDEVDANATSPPETRAAESFHPVKGAKRCSKGPEVEDSDDDVIYDLMHHLYDNSLYDIYDLDPFTEEMRAEWEAQEVEALRVKKGAQKHRRREYDMAYRMRNTTESLATEEAE